MYRKREKREKPVSVLQGDEKFLMKILSRSTSVGPSVRLSSYRSSGQVPFKWEMKPGTPRNLSNGEISIMSEFNAVEEEDQMTTADEPIFQWPLPAAVQNSGLEKPRSSGGFLAKQGILISYKMTCSWSKMIWKQIKINKKKKKKVHEGSVDDYGDHCGAFDNNSGSLGSVDNNSGHSSDRKVNVQSSILKGLARIFVKRLTAKPL
ncbi:hypothetical protein ACOSQ3_015907 [Xanthoceras sorbifolium]